MQVVREFKNQDIKEMINIWNKIVEKGNAFPQDVPLDEKTGLEFFRSQTYCGVYEIDGKIVGLYILHPNNVGRCSHICNASYAVLKEYRGKKIGESLVLDCLKIAKKFDFKILQFNAVVSTNIPARRLYEKLGFIQLGTIKGGFKMLDGTYSDICPYYIEL